MDRPCTTTVKITTAYVTTSRSTRHGESGSVRASAIEMPPRRPVQVSTSEFARFVAKVFAGQQQRHGDTDQPRDDGERYGKGDRQQFHGVNDQSEQLQTDQQEQHAVQKLIEQRPETDQCGARSGADSEPLRGRADAQPGADDRDRARRFAEIGKAIAAQHQRQRDQELQAIVGNAPHQQRRRPAGDQAERGAADDLAQQSRQDVSMTEHQCVALGHAERKQEQHHAGAVIEQALADNSGPQLRRQSHLLQEVFDHDRVGGSEDGAEDKAPHQRNGRANHREREPHAGAKTAAWTGLRSWSPAARLATAGGSVP